MPPVVEKSGTAAADTSVQTGASGASLGSCDCCGRLAVLSRTECCGVETYACAVCFGYPEDAFDEEAEDEPVAAGIG